MVSPNQVPSKIEQTVNGGMGGYKSLRLDHRFEASHPTFSHPGCLMGLLSSIILILLGTVDRLWHHFPMSDRITAQFISHDLPGLAAMIP